MSPSNYKAHCERKSRSAKERVANLSPEEYQAFIKRPLKGSSTKPEKQIVTVLQQLGYKTQSQYVIGLIL